VLASNSKDMQITMQNCAKQLHNELTHSDVYRAVAYFWCNILLPWNCPTEVCCLFRFV